MPPQQQTAEQFIDSLVPIRKQIIEKMFDLPKKDNYLSDQEAVLKLVAGIEKGVNVIKTSYGSTGSNTMIRSSLRPFHEVTNDGKKQLDALRLADPYEDIGLDMLKEGADKTDKESGDARKSTAILIGGITAEGIKVKEDPMTLKRSLDECHPIILKSIDEQTKTITVDEVGFVASVASENPKLGVIFQEIYQKIGKDGIVTLDNSNLPETSYDITEGVKLTGCGFTYPYMANADKGRKCEFVNPYILITKQKIMTVSQLDGLMKTLYTKHNRDELVIFCEDMDVSVSQSLAYFQIQGFQDEKGQTIKFKTLVIKAPTLWKDWLYEDFAKITGATIIDPTQGTTLKNIQLSHLGSCDKIITSKEETVVLGTRDISQHIQVIKDQGTDESKIRVSRLQTKTAVLKLGANSESDLSHLMGKALDARNSSWLALQGGVVHGGGIALKNAINAIPSSIGGNVLKKALAYPLKQICENEGLSEKEITKRVTTENIYDAAIVVKTAITNALSIASTALTVRNVIQ